MLGNIRVFNAKKAQIEEDLADYLTNEKNSIDDRMAAYSEYTGNVTFIDSTKEMKEELIADWLY